MKVLYDPQIFVLQEQGGISRYFAELIRCFNEHPELGIEPVLGFKESSNSALISLLAFPKRKTFHAPILIWASIFRALIFRPTISKVDIVHHTYFLKSFFRFANPKALHVVTVYDMIPEIFKQTTFPFKSHYSKKWYVKNSDAVLSISAKTAKDVERFYNFPAQDMLVTHLGVSGEFFRKELVQSRVPVIEERYILIVGNRHGYKDALTSFHAFEKITKENPNLKLVLVGGGKLTKSEVKTLKVLGIHEKTIQISASEEELPSIYARANALFFASRYEGFGFPPIEAMASGCPAIVADVDIMREVSKDAALYFTPGDADDLAAKYFESQTKELNLALVENGKAHAAHYTWYECAKNTAKVYRALSSSRTPE